MHILYHRHLMTLCNSWFDSWFNVLRTKISFEAKKKTFFLVSKVLSFRLKTKIAKISRIKSHFQLYYQFRLWYSVLRKVFYPKWVSCNVSMSWYDQMQDVLDLWHMFMSFFKENCFITWNDNLWAKITLFFLLMC